MSSDSLTDKICAAFEERNIAVKRNAISSSLEDSATGRENAEWASKHLHPETLLSREELILYTKLENSGTLDSLLRDPDLSGTRPLLEDDIRSAIESLEASTAGIQKRREVLSLHCDVLRKQLRRQEGLDQEESQDLSRLRKKHETGRRDTTIAANELSDELEASFRRAADRTGQENKWILSSLSAQLKTDDKALAALETVVSGVKLDRNDASIIKRTTDLSAMLANYSAEEIHFRLDRIYLGAAQGETSNYDGNSSDAATIAALKEELESLYSEVEVLAELSTKQQFYEPILREIHKAHSQLRAASQQRMEEALDILVEMTVEKQTRTKQLNARESSCELLEQLASLHQAEAGILPVPQPPSRRESLRRRSMQPGALLAAARHTAPVPERPALESFLRRIGVIPESVLRPRAEGGGAQELHEKRLHMSNIVHGLGIAVESPLVTQMTPSDRASRLLTSSLHADSYFETSLSNPDYVEALLDLETDLASLQKGVQGLKLDVLHRRDRAQDKFLERWS